MTEQEENQLLTEHRDLLGDQVSISVGSGWFHPLNSLLTNIKQYVDSRRESREFAMQHNLMLAQARAGDFTMYNQKYSSWYKPEDIERYRTEWLKTAKELPVGDPVVMPSVQQIKEKFGGLRVYLSDSDDYIDGLIRMTESWCAHTCEECGKSGRSRDTGWIRVLCDEHYEEAKEQERRYG